MIFVNGPETLLIGLNAAALCLAPALAADRAIRKPAERPWIVLGGFLAVAVCVAWFLVVGTRVPTHWVCVLQEGFTSGNLHHLVGPGEHAGPDLRAIASLVGGRHTDVRNVISVDYLVGWLSAVVLFVEAVVVLKGRWLAAALTAYVFLMNRNFVNAILAGGPAPVVGFYFLIGVFGAAVAVDGCLEHSWRAWAGARPWWG